MAKTIDQKGGIKGLQLISDGTIGILGTAGTRIVENRDRIIPREDKNTQNDVLSCFPEISSSSIEKRLKEIEENKKLARKEYAASKECIKQALNDIKNTGGQFDYGEVSSHVTHLIEFFTAMDNPFSYLPKEVFSFEDYLYNHSINVCAIATTLINKFNSVFSTMINGHLNGLRTEADYSVDQTPEGQENTYHHFQRDEIKTIALGFFLHDIGKVMVPDDILNKAGKLTKEEFGIVQKHSYEFGRIILEKNKIDNPLIANIVKYHHAPLYKDENRCYPMDIALEEIPIYAKACKLADIYDAMTSKKSYKGAFNQINAVTDIYRIYAGKDTMLQILLHSFIKSIGIHPPGSILFLRNGQMGYVLESKGPFVVPFTDTKGVCLSRRPDPYDLSDRNLNDSMKIDNRRRVGKLSEVYNLLPSYLKPTGI